ncbi:hypothetical protein [Alkalibacterium gilvum]|uniref:hypothetical protein n=1 Tax=Alkalibacterium gilvum TaxID=1130080 RepID=UPI003F8E5B84
MKTSVKVCIAVSAIFAFVAIYDIASMFIIFLPYFSEAYYHIALIISVLFFVIAILLNRGFNKPLKILGYSYAGVAGLLIIYAVGSILAMLTA